MKNNAAYWKALRKQFENMPRYTLSPEVKKAMSNLNALGQSWRLFAQSDAMKAAIRMADQIKNLNLSIPQGMLANMKRIQFFSVLDEMEWPLYLVFSDEFMTKINEQRSRSTDLNYLIFEYCNRDLLEKLENDWNRSSVMQMGRLPILKEAVVLYYNEHYYGAVSILMCQLMGIITDTYNMQKSYGKDFTLEDITTAFENYNPGKSAKECVNTRGGNYKRKEKNQLLWFLSDAQEGILYWIHAVKYIYNIILTSNDNMSESMHPCRNKICHGEQLNFGTKEHALKAILTIDMMIRLAESLKKVNESEQESSR